MKQRISYTIVCVLLGVANSDYSTMRKEAKKVKSMSQRENSGDAKPAVKGLRRDLCGLNRVFTDTCSSTTVPPAHTTEGSMEQKPARTSKQDVKQYAYLHYYFGCFKVLSLALHKSAYNSVLFHHSK